MPAWLSTSIFWIILIVMLVGLFGLIVPIFPGIVVIWLAALVYGLITGFTPLGIGLLVLLTILMISGATIDNVLMAARAHKEGATWLTLAIGMTAGRSICQPGYPHSSSGSP